MATTKKSTAKRTTARKSTAKKTSARKSTAKKTTARRPTAKKSTTRKSTAKKTTARRPTAKSTARKSSAKKTTARRPIAKKTTATRATGIRRRTASPVATNKAVVTAIEKAWNTGDLPALDKHFAAGYENHAALPGMPTDLGAAKQAHSTAMQAFPDRNVELLDVIAEGDRVAIRTRVTGTNTGGAMWLGAPANDQSIDVESWAMYRLEDGKVTESWGLNDGLAVMVQLGAMELPPMADAPSDRDREQTLSLVGAD